MKNKIKYFFIILICSSVFFGGVIIFSDSENPDSKFFKPDCKPLLDLYRWDLQVFQSKPHANKDSLIDEIKIKMDPVFSLSKEHYHELMQDSDFRILSDSTYSFFQEELPYFNEINDGFCRYKNFLKYPKKLELWNQWKEKDLFRFLKLLKEDDNISLNKEATNLVVYIDSDIFMLNQPNFYPPFIPVDFSINPEDGSEWIIVGLHWFLGEEHVFYQTIPDYLRFRYDSVYITPMIFHQLGNFYIFSHTEFNSSDLMSNETLLASMISTAKPYFFAQNMLPEVADYRIFGFTFDEMDFLYNQEEFFWKEILLKEQLIYSSDGDLKDLYIIPGPNLTCPTRMGTWIGFRILEGYFENNDVSLKEVLLESDYQKILNKSNYQP